MKTLLLKSAIFSMVEDFTSTFSKAGRTVIYLVLLIIFSSAIALIREVVLNFGSIHFTY